MNEDKISVLNLTIILYIVQVQKAPVEPLGHKTGLNTEEQHVSTLGRIRDRAEYDTKNWCFDTLDFQYILIRFINDMYLGFINKESIYKIKWKYMTKGCIYESIMTIVHKLKYAQYFLFHYRIVEASVQIAIT